MHARLGAGLIVALLALGTFGVPARPLAAAPLPANCEIPCTLTVTLTGNGSGTWLSTNSSYVPDGTIHCELLNGAITAGSDCSGQYGGIPRVSPLTVYFIKTPATGSCLLDAPDCAEDPVTGLYVMTGDGLQGAQSATFQRLAYRLTVTRSGAGMGTVTSVPEGIACGNSCFADYLYGTAVTLYAGPDALSYFVGWTGAACAGQGPGCSLTIPAAATTVNAVFGAGTGPPTAAPTAKPTAKPTARPTAGPTSAATAVATISPATAGPTPVASPGESLATASALASRAVTPAPSTSGSATAAPVDPAPAATSTVNPVGVALFVLGVLGLAWFFQLRRRRSPPS